MVALPEVICFSVVLSLVSCQGALPLAEDEVSPVVNLKLDPRKKMLTWNYRRNVTHDNCIIDTPLAPQTHTRPLVGEDGASWCCRFPGSVLHRGARLAVLGVAADGHEFEEVLAFDNPGREGSGAVNFSCFLYNIRFMNCSWAPGPAAPGDVRYRLYSWFSNEDDETECPQYILDSAGTRVGCHFDRLGEDPKTSDNYFFLVNGTSGEAAIPFLDFVPFVPARNEKYNPPANVTVSYEGANAVIRWDNPKRRFQMAVSTFYYEVDIQRKGSSQKKDPIFQRGEDRNEYQVPGSEAKAENTVRIRVRHRHGTVWSGWSEMVPFGVGEDGHGRTAVFLLVVMGTAALSAAVLMLLCKRCSDRLFAPIPQVKGDLVGVFLSNQEATWAEPSPAPAQEQEDIVTVEETPRLPSGQADISSPEPPHTFRKDPLLC